MTSTIPKRQKDFCRAYSKKDVGPTGRMKDKRTRGRRRIQEDGTLRANKF